jgi:uncharacterized protein (TIGR02246 family)
MAAAGLVPRFSHEGITMTENQKAIASVLTNYAAALKAADAEAVTRLYTEDGVLMAQESLPAVGSAAVRKAYVDLFQAIGLEITFHLAEVVELTPEWAFARTTSTGTIKINATGARVPEANQELFIFKKTASGTWKIARYSFSVINPPPKQ